MVKQQPKRSKNRKVTRLPGQRLVFIDRDVGCYADDTLGDAHFRHALADMVQELAEETGNTALLDSLRSDPADWPEDLNDEEEAVELLNSITDIEGEAGHAVIWIMEDSELCLMLRMK